MADMKKFEDNPQRQLLDKIDGARCVMLGSPDHHAHMQPMAPQVDPAAGVIYFYSDNESTLGQTILESPGEVHMCHIEEDYQACLRGQLQPHHDRATIDKFWGPMVDAWYPGGKDDPKMLMLKFVPEHAAVWASDMDWQSVEFEVDRANAANETPDLGKTKEIPL